MPELSCSVKNCLYNKSECCCRGEIKVEGEHAKISEDTCCGSFEEQHGESYKSAVEQPCKCTDVACDVCDCVFNKRFKCNADSIGIAGHDACCCSQTECASFTCK